MCIRPKKCIILSKIIGRNNMYKRIISEHKKTGKFVIKVIKKKPELMMKNISSSNAHLIKNN
jgi:hypothetical protein